MTFESMCNPACIRFALDHLHREEIGGKSVIEVGSCNVNGSFRDHVRYFGPASYLGVDAASGPGVDQVCDAARLVETFGPESFDLLISTEMLEHVRDWTTVITNMKQLVRPGGTIVITTRSFGFPFHSYPDDFWRFETEDMQRIFADFHIRVLMPDPSEPGVFLKAVRPAHWTPVELNAIELYSMQVQKRTLTGTEPFIT
jgi:SAM-dependent methyltransferase